MTSGLVAGTVPFSAVDGPGSRYVVFLQGCGWDCLACYNPVTIPTQPRGAVATSVEEVVAGIVEAAPFLTGVTVSGGEPTRQPEFLLDLLTALAEHPATAHLTRLEESNGDASIEVWDRLSRVLDGALVDLKSIDTERHIVLTGHGNHRVLASIVRLAALGTLQEVRLLLVPGINDDDSLLTRTAHWLVALDRQLAVRVNSFQRHGTRACARDLLEVTDDDRHRYRRVLTAAGVQNLTIS